MSSVVARRFDSQTAMPKTIKNQDNKITNLE